jgi:hypothetical protein
MNQRGEYGRSARLSNGHARQSGYASRGWYEWIGAGAEADADLPIKQFKQIDAEMEVIIDAFYRAMGVDPAAIRHQSVTDEEAWKQRVRAVQTKAKQSPLWAYWESDVSPKYGDWRSTRAAFLTSPMPSAEYDRWLDRVKQLRADVKAKGIKLETPDPVSLSQPVGDVGGMDSSKIVKWVAIGGAAILGVVAVVTLASSTKQARAPYERYRYGYFATR